MRGLAAEAAVSGGELKAAVSYRNGDQRYPMHRRSFVCDGDVTLPSLFEVQSENI